MIECKMIEEIILYEREANAHAHDIKNQVISKIEFPHLLLLKLNHLPELLQYYTNHESKTTSRSMPLFDEKVQFSCFLDFAYNVVNLLYCLFWYVSFTSMVTLFSIGYAIQHRGIEIGKCSIVKNYGIVDFKKAFVI